MEGPYWPSLMKDKKKVHWLKIDFNRWRDEDDSEPEDGAEPEQDLDEVSSSVLLVFKSISISSLIECISFFFFFHASKFDL